MELIEGVFESADTVAVFMCPNKDGHPMQNSASYLDVTVRDQFGAPMPGVLVEATFADSVYLENPCTGTTDGAGHVLLYPEGGVIRKNVLTVPQEIDSLAYVSTTTVTCMGVTIYQNPRPFLSPDYNGDGVVEALDHAYFSRDWLSRDPESRSNFTRDCELDGTCVEARDATVFTLHWLHN
jgi:hypothetical protein